jgi:hypothetical protein
LASAAGRGPSYAKASAGKAEDKDGSPIINAINPINVINYLLPGQLKGIK